MIGTDKIENKKMIIETIHKNFISIGHQTLVQISSLIKLLLAFTRVSITPRQGVDLYFLRPKRVCAYVKLFGVTNNES